MSQTIAVPLTITPEATDFVRELGLQAQLEQMLEHARQIIPGLYKITVSLEPQYDEPGELAVIIDALSDDPAVSVEPFGSIWGRWKMNAFPPEVFRHFTLIDHFVPPHAG